MRNHPQAAFGYRSPRCRSERGADIVEAAFVLPIVLTLFMGLIVLARGWDIYQSMTRAAREGVRQAVTTSCATCGNSYYSNTHIENDIVFPALKTVGIDPSNPVLTNTYKQGFTWLDQSDQVCGAYISFEYPYTIKLPFISVDLGTVYLRTRAQMRLENDLNDGSCPP